MPLACPPSPESPARSSTHRCTETAATAAATAALSPSQETHPDPRRYLSTGPPVREHRQSSFLSTAACNLRRLPSPVLPQPLCELSPPHPPAGGGCRPAPCMTSHSGSHPTTWSSPLA